jgi:cytochrome c-type biogenesis protein CcmF
MLPLIFLVGLGMHTAWRSQDLRALINQVRIPAIVALIVGSLVPTVMYGGFSPLATVGTIAAFWIIGVSLMPIIRSVRRTEGASRITRAALGMSVAHLGLGAFVLGVTIVSAFTVEADVSMKIGERTEVAGFSFELRDLRNVQGPNYRALEGEVEIRQDGDFIATLRPQKRTYLVQQSPMTEAGILAHWNKDLFVALGDPLGNNAWSMRIQYKPMIRFIWFGALIMALGGLIAASDRRYRVNAPAKAGLPAKEQTV